MSYRKYLMTDDVPPSELYKTVKIDTDSDTISRAKAIEIAMECYDNNELFEVYERKLRQLPPTQPKRIRGKWMHDGSKWKNRWICSNCGYKWFFDCIEGAYCPNCGAMMEVTT